MTESILNSIKQMLGITKDYKAFDNDIITDINTVLAILVQMGLGKANFILEGESETWDDFLGDDPHLSLVKTYVFMKVKLMFDIPTSGPTIEAYDRQISELEWRINAVVDPEDDNSLME